MSTSSSSSSTLSNNLNNNINNTEITSTINGLQQSVSSSTLISKQLPAQQHLQHQTTNYNIKPTGSQTSSNANNLNAFITNYPSYMPASAQINTTNKNFATSDGLESSSSSPSSSSINSANVESNNEIGTIHRSTVTTQ